MLKLISLCGATTVGMALICTGCATAQTPAPPPIKAAPATAWTKRVKITATAVPETDGSQLLGLNMWRFIVTAPKPVHQVSALIEVQEQNKPSHVLLRMLMNPQMRWPMNKHWNFFVGQYMPSGGRVEAADMVKYQLRAGSFRPAPLTEIGGSTSEALVTNPFSGMKDWEVFSGPEQRSDGSFKLISGRKFVLGGDFGPPNVVLMFRVEEESN
jgi:hypothetical protein